MKFVNLTPHKIVVMKKDSSKFEIEPSGVVARVATLEKVAGEIDGIPVIKRDFGNVENLPELQEGTIYIVSSLVLGAIKNRPDVVAPDTGATAIRNSQGQIEAITRFVIAS